MRKITVFLAAALAVALAWAEESKPDGKPKLSKEELRAKRELRIMKRFGGYVEKHEPDEGRVLFANSQDVVPVEAFEPYLAAITDEYHVRLPIEQWEGSVGVENAAAEVARSKANAVVFVVDSESLPSLLVAPENRWAMLNIRPIIADSPSEDVLARRVQLEVWRAFGYLCGAANSQAPGCVMASVNSLADLDRLEAQAISPEPYMSIVGHLKSIGVKPYEIYTYQEACEQGWAPAPTNEYQRVIWEKVNSEKEQGPAVQRPIRRQGVPRKAK